MVNQVLPPPSTASAPGGCFDSVGGGGTDACGGVKGNVWTDVYLVGIKETALIIKIPTWTTCAASTCTERRVEGVFVLRED